MCTMYLSRRAKMDDFVLMPTSVLVQRKSSSGRTMLGVALNGDASQKYSLSQSDDDDDNTRADEDEGELELSQNHSLSKIVATDTASRLLPCQTTTTTRQSQSRCHRLYALMSSL